MMATKSYERELGGVQQKLAEIDKNQQSHVAETKEHREKIHQKIDDLESKVDSGFDEIRNILTDQRIAQEKRDSAVKTVIAVAGVVGAGAGTAAKPLLALLGLLK